MMTHNSQCNYDGSRDLDIVFYRVCLDTKARKYMYFGAADESVRPGQQVHC